MKFFCRIYGHTWIHETQAPEISWNNDKGLVELFPRVIAAEGEDEAPQFFRRCVRCGEQRPWEEK
jgi:hypothetical protein